MDNKTFDLTTQDVAKVLNVSIDTVKRLTAHGKIPAIKTGGVWKFNKEELNAYVESLRNRPLNSLAG